MRNFKWSFVVSVVILAVTSTALYDPQNPGTNLATQQERVIELATLQNYENVVPVLIIGSGPAGLGAALHPARDNKFPVIVMGDEPGGLLTRTGEVENWLGVPTTRGQDAIDHATQQVASFGTKFLYDTVTSVDVHEWPFEVHTADGLTLHALTLVIATGARPRTLGVPGEQESWGRGLSTCAKCDAWAYKNAENVVVVGGGESAIEEAIQLAQHAKEVTILVRGGSMRATAHSQELLAHYPAITVVYHTVVQEIVLSNAEQPKVEAVKIMDTRTHRVRSMATTGVFLAIGHRPNTQLFTDSVVMDQEGYITLTGRTQETSVRGVFAAGDVADNMYRQAPYAGAMGIAAGIDACRELHAIGLTPAVIAALQQSPQQAQLMRNLR